MRPLESKVGWYCRCFEDVCTCINEITEEEEVVNLIENIRDFDISSPSERYSFENNSTNWRSNENNGRRFFDPTESLNSFLRSQGIQVDNQNKTSNSGTENKASTIRQEFRNPENHSRVGSTSYSYKGENIRDGKLDLKPRPDKSSLWDPIVVTFLPGTTTTIPPQKRKNHASASNLSTPGRRGKGNAHFGQNQKRNQLKKGVMSNDPTSQNKVPDASSSNSSTQQKPSRRGRGRGDKRNWHIPNNHFKQTRTQYDKGASLFFEDDPLDTPPVKDTSQEPPKQTKNRRMKSQCNKELKKNNHECPICYEDMANRHPEALLCGHVVCKSCVRTLIQNRMMKCPICAKAFNSSDVRSIYLV